MVENGEGQGRVTSDWCCISALFACETREGVRGDYVHRGRLYIDGMEQCHTRIPYLQSLHLAWDSVLCMM